MPNKQLSERLNRELDSIGVPEATTERIEVFAKLMKIPKFKAEALLNGIMSPNDQVLKILARELEVTEEWLLGKSDSQSH